jgi:hypothetical protein
MNVVNVSAVATIGKQKSTGLLSRCSYTNRTFEPSLRFIFEDSAHGSRLFLFETQ